MTAAPEPGPGPAFRFQVQPEFHEIPLGIDADPAAFDEQLRGFARDYWGDAEELDPLRRLMAALYGVTAQDLTAGGAVYQALGVFPIGGTADETEPPERYSRATLTVSVRELENPDPHVSAAGIAEVLDKSAESGEVQPIVLPAGPAVVHIAGTRAVWDLPAQSGDPCDPAGAADPAPAEGEQERFFVRIEVWLPFPDEDRLLLLCLSTPDTQDLFHYQAVLADIADTITFGDQAPTASADAATAKPAASPIAAY
ncbi:hypothetical protein [Streptomyces sp. NPDC046939]|uniref:hypothetical protein n=1 Tax=Streptomyces sp. NPDC046939 TaxID=3155376 RepID=UPI0033D587A6